MTTEQLLALLRDLERHAQDAYEPDPSHDAADRLPRFQGVKVA